jgi:hypothetical protein
MRSALLTSIDYHGPRAATVGRIACDATGELGRAIWAVNGVGEEFVDGSFYGVEAAREYPWSAQKELDRLEAALAGHPLPRKRDHRDWCIQRSDPRRAT